MNSLGGFSRFRGFFHFETPSRRLISETGHARRPLTLIGLSGPFSRHAQRRRVCCARFRWKAASDVGRAVRASQSKGRVCVFTEVMINQIQVNKRQIALPAVLSCLVVITESLSVRLSSTPALLGHPAQAIFIYEDECLFTLVNVTLCYSTCANFRVMVKRSSMKFVMQRFLMPQHC